MDKIKVTQEDAAKIALMGYRGMKCSVCGKPISNSDLNTAVVSSINPLSLAHESCWVKEDD